jgi:exopolyphosphatase / guanosine-5'-triphosphate,3'-diphosphate pyrophosphatase
MLCGCIDIGTNTTRVLVAEARPGGLTEVLQRRAFTRLGRGLAPGGTIPAARIAETASVVAEQHALAEQAGATSIRAVATAVIRRAANRDEFCDAIRAHGGVEVCVLDGTEEARLAFLGATRTLGRPLPGRVAVVDVGGGSTEIAVGTIAGGVEWSASFPFGSGFLADAYLGGDPPDAHELSAVRMHADRALSGIDPGPVDIAIAVGGSAASLRRLVGEELDELSLSRALRVLTSGPAPDVAARFDLDAQRVRLMPAGLLALDAAAHALGRPLQIGNGGLREGVLIDLAGM